MPGFDPGDVVRVPFPYSDGGTRQHRPALVIASVADGFLVWVLMVTSTANRAWPGDVPIPDHVDSGLPTPSIIRTAKVATIEAARAEPLGAIMPATLALVRDAVVRTLSLPV